MIKPIVNPNTGNVIGHYDGTTKVVTLGGYIQPVSKHTIKYLAEYEADEIISYDIIKQLTTSINERAYGTP